VDPSRDPHDAPALRGMALPAGLLAEFYGAASARLVSAHAPEAASRS
jgi:hypothetical protein